MKIVTHIKICLKIKKSAIGLLFTALYLRPGRQYGFSIYF